MNGAAEKAVSAGKVQVLAPGRFRHMEQLLVILYGGALLIADVLMLGAAFRLAYWIRFELKIALQPEVRPILYYYQDVSFVMALGCLLLFAFSGLYNWHNLVGGTSEYSRACNAFSISVAIIILATFIFPEFVIARGWVLYSWPLAIVLVVAARFALRRMVYYLRTKGYFLVRTVVVGVNAESLSLAKELGHPRSGYRVVGLLRSTVGETLPENLESENALPVLGSLDDIEEVAQKLGIEELVVSSSALPRRELFDLYERVHDVPGLELRLSTGLFELLTTGVQVRTAGLVPLIGLKKMRLDLSELIVKTASEYVLTTVGLILISPLLLYLAIRVKLDSPGPIIHRRRVLGVGGKEFDAFKFRTMVVNGDEILEQHPELVEELRQNEKLKEDPRITKVGRWMRRFSLDELPQLFNVLMGQMSLVGPRMITKREADRYGMNRYNLLAVKPGITGMWQVSGRSDLSYEERIRSDMWYVRNYTLWLDFHLLFVKTANAVLKGRGAY